MIFAVPLLPILVGLFIIVPIVEIYVLIQVGQAIGALPTIGLLVADSILGSLLMRSQGRTVWRRFNAAIGSGRPPAREIVDGVFVIFGGALLLTPGFATDIFGILALLPPTRAILARIVLRTVMRRVRIVTPARGSSRSATVEGQAREVDR